MSQTYYLENEDTILVVRGLKELVRLNRIAYETETAVTVGSANESDRQQEERKRRIQLLDIEHNRLQYHLSQLRNKPTRKIAIPHVSAA